MFKTALQILGSQQDAEDVMKALKNNPLLKKGVPERINTETTGTNPRDIEF